MSDCFYTLNLHRVIIIILNISWAKVKETSYEEKMLNIAQVYIRTNALTLTQLFCDNNTRIHKYRIPNKGIGAILIFLYTVGKLKRKQ